MHRRSDKSLGGKYGSGDNKWTWITALLLLTFIILPPLVVAALWGGAVWLLGYAQYKLFKYSLSLFKRLKDSLNNESRNNDFGLFAFFGLVFCAFLEVILLAYFLGILAQLGYVVEVISSFCQDNYSEFGIILLLILFVVVGILVGIFTVTGSLKLSNEKGAFDPHWILTSPDDVSTSRSSNDISPTVKSEDSVLIWKRVGNEIHILGMCGLITELKIPNKIEGFPVTEICDGFWNNGNPTGAFSNNDGLTKVVLPSGLRRIGSYAFRGCDYLERVKLPSGLREIGVGAFYGCGNLERITLSEGVKEIRSDAFFNCASLERIKLPLGLTTLEKRVFYGCVSLRDVEFPETLTSIDDMALKSCASLTRLKLPTSLKRIGKKAFDGCVGLKEISFPPNLEEIGDCAFYSVPSLKAVALPVSVKSIGITPFESTTTVFTVPGSYGARWVDRHLRTNQVEEQRDHVTSNVVPTVHVSRYVSLPVHLREIVSPSVSDRRELLVKVRRQSASCMTFYLPHLDPQVFLTDPDAPILPPLDLPHEYVVPDSVGDKYVDVIGEAAFKNAIGITTIAAPFGIRRIENHAFYGCRRLENVFLPSTVRFIGARSFIGCSSLRMLVLPGSVTQIEEDAFEDATCLCVLPDSYAAKWAKEHGQTFRLVGRSKGRRSDVAPLK